MPRSTRALGGTQHTIETENPAFAQRWIATNDPETVQFPEGCVTTDLSPEEKVLAYMLFDISACIVPDHQPPAPPPVTLR